MAAEPAAGEGSESRKGTVAASSDGRVGQPTSAAPPAESVLFTPALATSDPLLLQWPPRSLEPPPPQSALPAPAPLRTEAIDVAEAIHRAARLNQLLFVIGTTICALVALVVGMLLWHESKLIRRFPPTKDDGKFRQALVEHAGKLEPNPRGLVRFKNLARLTHRLLAESEHAGSSPGWESHFFQTLTAHVKGHGSSPAAVPVSSGLRETGTPPTTSGVPLDPAAGE